MKQGTWKPTVLFIALCEGAGALAGCIVRPGIEGYVEKACKPPLTPPGWVFPLVWTALYLLMALGAARVWESCPSPERKKALTLFGAQLAVNVLWTLVFFGLVALGASVVVAAVLWALVLWMYLAYKKLDAPAAKLQLPYLVWLTYATYLTAGVWLLNR